MQPAPPNPVQQNGRQGRSHLGHQVSLFTGTSVQTEVVCRFCGVQGPRKLMIAPCACSTDETRYIHRSCLNTQRWTDPNPAAFKKCLACDLDYHMQLRPGAAPDKSMTARFFRYVCADAFALIFFLVGIELICTGFIERMDSCFTAPGGCGEHCTGCCNLPPGVNQTGICPRGGDLLNGAFAIDDNDHNGGVKYLTTYFCFGAGMFGVLLGVLGLMDMCCVVKEYDPDEECEEVIQRQERQESINPLHRPGGGPRVVEDPEEDDKLPPPDSPVSFLCYVYCCMCVGGNAKKGFHACCRDVWDQRECVWCRGMKGMGRGCNDLFALVFMYVLALMITVIVFVTMGVLVGVVLVTIQLARIVRRHRRLMKRRLKVKDYVVQDLSLLVDGDDENEENQTLLSGGGNDADDFARSMEMTVPPDSTSMTRQTQREQQREQREQQREQQRQHPRPPTSPSPSSRRKPPPPSSRPPSSRRSQSSSSSSSSRKPPPPPPPGKSQRYQRWAALQANQAPADEDVKAELAEFD